MEYVKCMMTLTRKELRQLEEMARENRVTQRDELISAIAEYALLDDAQSEGATILLENDDEFKQVILR
jgi:DNA-binding response OmpR family regulator